MIWQKNLIIFSIDDKEYSALPGGSQIAFGSLGSPLFSSIGGILFGAAVNQKAPQAALDYNTLAESGTAWSARLSWLFGSIKLSAFVLHKLAFWWSKPLGTSRSLVPKWFTILLVRNYNYQCVCEWIHEVGMFKGWFWHGRGFCRARSPRSLARSLLQLADCSHSFLSWLNTFPKGFCIGTISKAHTHTHMHTDTHTHVVLYGLRGLSIGVMVFILYKLYVLLPYTYSTPKLSPHRRRCISIFPQKKLTLYDYKRFKLWGHWKCLHKSPSPCNTYVIPMSLYKFVSS